MPKEAEIKLNLDMHIWKISPECNVEPSLENIEPSVENIEPTPQTDTNVFPGLGPVAEAMHTSIFGSAAQIECDYRESLTRAFQIPSSMLEAGEEYAAAIGRDTIRDSVRGIQSSEWARLTAKEIIEISERVEKIAKAARRTQRIAAFKSRIKRTWHLFSTIPQTIRAIWTTPPMTAEQVLMNSVSDMWAFSTRYSDDVDFSRIGVIGRDYVRSQRCYPMSAFCTPSRNPLTGKFSFDE